MASAISALTALCVASRSIETPTAAMSNAPPDVTFNGFHAEGYILEPGSGAEQVLARAHEGATGRKLENFMMAGYRDTRVYALYDRIPALCYGPISRNIHGIDEVQRITGTIALFIAEWCARSRARVADITQADDFSHPLRPTFPAYRMSRA